jgi:hypothetical protein
MLAQIMNVGKFKIVSDARTPFFATLRLLTEDKGEPSPDVIHPLDEETFFRFLNSFLTPKQEACGMVHVPVVTVTIPSTT